MTRFVMNDFYFSRLVISRGEFTPFFMRNFKFKFSNDYRSAHRASLIEKIIFLFTFKEGVLLWGLEKLKELRPN